MVLVAPRNPLNIGAAARAITCAAAASSGSKQKKVFEQSMTFRERLADEASWQIYRLRPFLARLPAPWGAQALRNNPIIMKITGLDRNLLKTL